MLCWLKVKQSTLHCGTVFCARCSAYTSHFDILCNRLNIYSMHTEYSRMPTVHSAHIYYFCSITYSKSVPKNSNSSKNYASLKLKCCIIIQRGHADVQTKLIKTALLATYIYKWLFSCGFDRPSFKFMCRYAVCLSTRLSIKRILLSPSALIYNR